MSKACEVEHIVFLFQSQIPWFRALVKIRTRSDLPESYWFKFRQDQDRRFLLVILKQHHKLECSFFHPLHFQIPSLGPQPQDFMAAHTQCLSSFRRTNPAAPIFGSAKVRHTKYAVHTTTLPLNLGSR